MKTHYENGRNPLRKRRPTTKTKTGYENEDLIIFKFLTRRKRKTDRVIQGQEDI